MAPGFEYYKQKWEEARCGGGGRGRIRDPREEDLAEQKNVAGARGKQSGKAVLADGKGRLEFKSDPRNNGEPLHILRFVSMILHGFLGYSQL